MDSRFADRMAELGQIDSPTLNGRWGGVVSIANNADHHQRARLVMIASRDVVDRERDEWFWRPFREVEDTFRIDDAVELHARLAEAAARQVIADGDLLLPVLVRLAQHAGRSFLNDDLVNDSDQALNTADVELPAAPTSKRFWTKPIQDALKPDATPDPAVIATHLSSIAAYSQDAVASLERQVRALTEWASSAEQRFSSGQALLEWLLAGVRDDRTPWKQLPAQVVAVDAAAEISGFVPSVPSRTHEALLAQVLAVSSAKSRSTKSTQGSIRTKFDPIDSSTLATLAPITSELAAGREVPDLDPPEVGLRVLWEMSARWLWNAHDSSA